MVRVYCRKTSKGANINSYSRDDLQLAIKEVKEGTKTTRGAAIHYNIPRSTLRHYISGTRGQKGIVSSNNHGGGGRTALRKEEEEELAAGLKIMEKWGYGLSKSEVLDIVQNYVITNELKTRFYNGRPGNEWFLSFSKRHGLSIKKPQGMEYVRQKQTNPFVIFGFYDILEKTIKELNLQGKPDMIFNCDETSFCSDPNKTKVVGAVGAKSTRIISSAGRENTSVLICCSASGKKLMPLCIFKGLNVLETWISTDIQNRMAYAASKRGWMDSDIFYNWFEKCFLTSIPIERPILLIYDGHVSHISLKLIKKAKQNGIVILKLPPHTTHLLQPLDVAVFKSLKSKWDKDLCKWQRSNPRKRLPKRQFVDLLNKVYNDVPTSIIIKGFEKTGIYNAGLGGPNREVISEDIFELNVLKQYETSINQKTKQSLQKASNTKSTIEIQSKNSEDDPQTSDKNITNTILNEHSYNIIENAGMSKETDKEQPTQNEERTLRTINEGQNQNSDQNLEGPDTSVYSQSFENILLGFIKQGKDKTETGIKKRTRICSGAEIITSEEFILEREKKENVFKKTKFPHKKEIKNLEKAVNNRVLRRKKIEVKRCNSDTDSSSVKDFNAETDEEENPACLYCNEEYKISKLHESWHKCQLCAKWAHSDCAGINRKSKTFVCDLCV